MRIAKRTPRSLRPGGAQVFIWGRGSGCAVRLPVGTGTRAWSGLYARSIPMGERRRWRCQIVRPREGDQDDEGKVDEGKKDNNE